MKKSLLLIIAVFLYRPGRPGPGRQPDLGRRIQQSGQLDHPDRQRQLGLGQRRAGVLQEENVEIARRPRRTRQHRPCVITAKQESGPGIVDQWGNPLQYTSGKVVSKSMVTVKYGMIETRVRIPDIDLGGWPARLAAGQRQLRLAPLRRDRPDGDGGQAGLPRSARHPQRRQRSEQFHREPGGGRQRHLLLGRGHQSGESLRGRRAFPGIRTMSTAVPTSTTTIRSSTASWSTGCTGTRTACA